MSQIQFDEVRATEVPNSSLLIIGGNDNPRLGFSDSILADNPIAYWPLGEDPAGPAVDQRGNVNGVYRKDDTTAFGGAVATVDVLTPGLFGQERASRFNTYTFGTTPPTTRGSSLFVPVDPDIPREFVNGFTAECLWRPDATGRYITMLDVRYYALYVSWDPQRDGGTLWVGFKEGRDSTYTGLYSLRQPRVFEVGRDYHLAITYDPVGGFHLYIDGLDVFQGAVGNGVIIDDTLGSFLDRSFTAAGIGGEAGGQTVSDAALYDYPLTPQQIEAHYAALITPPDLFPKLDLYPNLDLYPDVPEPGGFVEAIIGLYKVDDNTLILSSREVQRRIHLPSGDLTLTVT